VTDKLKPYEKCYNCGHINVGVKATLWCAITQVVLSFGFALKWFTHLQPYANAFIVGGVIAFLIYLVFYALMMNVIDAEDRRVPTITLNCSDPLTQEDVERINRILATRKQPCTSSPACS
jgi:hypothetical protein